MFIQNKNRKNILTSKKIPKYIKLKHIFTFVYRETTEVFFKNFWNFKRNILANQKQLILLSLTKLCFVNAGNYGQQRWCSLSGDPHYVSFDGTQFDYQGKCLYDLVKVREDVLETEEGKDLTSFKVEVSFKNCYSWENLELYEFKVK